MKSVKLINTAIFMLFLVLIVSFISAFTFDIKSASAESFEECDTNTARTIKTDTNEIMELGDYSFIYEIGNIDDKLSITY